MSGQSEVAEPQVNVTPLIDVMLVLLVILIITLPVATHAVKLNLPQGDGVVPPRSVRVDIYSAGEVYWNDEHVDSIAQLISSKGGARRVSTTRPTSPSALTRRAWRQVSATRSAATPRLNAPPRLGLRFRTRDPA